MGGRRTPNGRPYGCGGGIGNGGSRHSPTAPSPNVSTGIPKGKTAGIPDYENSIRFPLWPSGESGDHTGGPRRLFGYFLAGEKVSCPLCTSFAAEDRFCRRAKSIRRRGESFGVRRGKIINAECQVMNDELGWEWMWVRGNEGIRRVPQQDHPYGVRNRSDRLTVNWVSARFPHPALRATFPPGEGFGAVIAPTGAGDLWGCGGGIGWSAGSCPRPTGCGGGTVVGASCKPYGCGGKFKKSPCRGGRDFKI